MSILKTLMKIMNNVSNHRPETIWKTSTAKYLKQRNIDFDTRRKDIWYLIVTIGWLIQSKSLFTAPARCRSESYTSANLKYWQERIQDIRRKDIRYSVVQSKSLLTAPALCRSEECWRTHLSMKHWKQLCYLEK